MSFKVIVIVVVYVATSSVNKDEYIKEFLKISEFLRRNKNSRA